VGGQNLLRRNNIDSDSLLPSISPCRAHQTSETVFRAGIFPIALLMVSFTYTHNEISLNAG
jgi:hypothetical protein